jgi:diguanylate cyclase (GGDEF)-like protein
MDSKIGLVIQFSGVVFITILLFFLTQSLKSTALGYWKKGWLCLSIALISLQFAFEMTSFTPPFYIIYYLGEYVFCYFLIAGCYNYTTNQTFARKSWFFIVPGFLLAGFLTFSTSDFNDNFNFHSIVMGTAFAVSCFYFKPKDIAPQNLGWKIMRVSLALLAIDFFHYTIIFSLEKTSLQIALASAYLAFNPVIDLMLEILLGFGMVIVLLERVSHQAEEANLKLKETHEKLEVLVQTDPLTAAFNRHAFHGFLKKKGGETGNVSGCVGFFDIDDLKPINDQFGHAVGDMAIRAVTRAIRELIRAEDLIFRWGGDEFFVIMVSMDEKFARQRMKKLADLLTNIPIDGTLETLSVSVSYGFKDFYDVSELELAIKAADAEMYQIKQARQRQKQTENIFIPQLQENQSNIYS